jgi:hypothetical protein
MGFDGHGWGGVDCVAYAVRGRQVSRLYWACLDGGVSVSLKQTNTKTNTFHPNTCVSLVLVGTNTPKKLTPPRGGNWGYFGGPHPFLSPSPFSNDWKSYFKCKLTPPSKHPRC